MQPATNTTISGCAAKFRSSFLVAYIGSDQRLYQFEWDNNHWVTVDLISQWQSVVGITLPFPRTGSGPRSAGPIVMNTLDTDAPGDSSVYLCYIDTNGHIQALQFPLYDETILPPGGSLLEAMNPDLTIRTGAPPAAAGSSIASYGWASQKSQHVVYVGTDGNVWELYWLEGQWDNVRGGPLWQANNLSERTGYLGELAPKKNGPMAATMFEREGTEHVVYIAADNTIRELYFYNGGWGGNNLTQAAGAAPPAANSPLAVYSADYEDTLHVVYLAEDGAIHELWWNQSGWQPDHAISQIYNPGPASNTALIGYACQYEQSHHVIYVDQTNSIQELYHNSNGWDITHLSLVARDGFTTPINSATPLAGYSFEELQQQHIWYLDDQSRVHEIARDKGQWYAIQTFG